MPLKFHSVFMSPGFQIKTLEFETIIFSGLSKKNTTYPPKPVSAKSRGWVTSSQSADGLDGSKIARRSF
jgi:hypothetical protein